MTNNENIGELCEKLAAKDAEIERLTARLTDSGCDLQAMTAEGWRPIDTAPKDGKNVLLVNRKGSMAAGLWMDGLSGSGWYLRGGSHGPDTFFNGHHGPTHWMPLPPAPDVA